MLSRKNSLTPLIPATHEVVSTYLTKDGEELVDSNPDAVEDFINISQRLSEGCRPLWNSGVSQIGEGIFADVVTLPNNDDLCIKVVSPGRTGDAAARRSDIQLKLSHSNLKVEAKFIHAVGKKLTKSRVEGLRTPKQYAVIAYAGTAALLQERIPDNFRNLEEFILRGSSLDEEKQAVEYGKQVVRDTRKALGFSPLQLGLQDIGDKLRGAHPGNVLTTAEAVATGEHDTFIIDLVPPFKPKQILAMASTALAI